MDLSKINELRPDSFKEFIGQNQIVQELKVYIFSAKETKKTLDHTLFIGPSGTGKTSLSFVIAKEFDTKIKTINAPMIESPQDLVEIIVLMKEGEILFIDEIHRLDRKIEEILYSVMDDFMLHIAYKSDEKTKIISVKIPHFTLIGATTLDGLISTPLLERFTNRFYFEPYTINELKEILRINSKKLDVQFKSEEELEFFVIRCRSNPRLLNNYLKRFKDFYIYKKQKDITISLIEDFFNFINVLEYGLTKFDVKILGVFYNAFLDTPVSLESVATIANESVINIKQNIEPFLVSIGFIKRTTRGRIITSLGKEFYEKKILKNYYQS